VSYIAVVSTVHKHRKVGTVHIHSKNTEYIGVKKFIDHKFKQNKLISVLHIPQVTL